MESADSPDFSYEIECDDDQRVVLVLDGTDAYWKAFEGAEDQTGHRVDVTEVYPLVPGERNPEIFIQTTQLIGQLDEAAALVGSGFGDGEAFVASADRLQQELADALDATGMDSRQNVLSMIDAMRIRPDLDES